jgi:hypothetical protein
MLFKIVRRTMILLSFVQTLRRNIFSAYIDPNTGGMLFQLLAGRRIRSGLKKDGLTISNSWTYVNRSFRPEKESFPIILKILMRAY